MFLYIQVFRPVVHAKHDLEHQRLLRFARRCLSDWRSASLVPLRYLSEFSFIVLRLWNSRGSPAIKP